MHGTDSYMAPIETCGELHTCVVLCLCFCFDGGDVAQRRRSSRISCMHAGITTEPEALSLSLLLPLFSFSSSILARHSGGSISAGRTAPNYWDKDKDRQIDGQTEGQIEKYTHTHTPSLTYGFPLPSPLLRVPACHIVAAAPFTICPSLSKKGSRWACAYA